MGEKSLAGKVAFVTGAAAKRGMGRAIALRLAKEGAKVTVADKYPAPKSLFPGDEGWRGFLTGLFDAVMYIMLKFTPFAEPVIGGKDLKRVSGLLWFNVS